MDFLVTKNKLFQNPQKLPLNELFLTVQNVKANRGSNDYQNKCPTERYPAIHRAFIDERTFSTYQEYYGYAENIEDSVQIYKSKGLMYIDGLDFLLCLNYHQFWCYVTKSASAISMLKSYICNFTQPFEMCTMEETCAEMANIIHSKVQTIFCRIFKFEHSPTEFMSENTVLQLVEECKLITFPIVVNFCVAFGKTCPQLVQSVTQLYFHDMRRKKWEGQTDIFLQHISTVFEMLGGLIYGFDDNAVKVSIGVPPKPAGFDPCWYEDILTYCLEALTTLNAMLLHCAPMTRKATQLGIPYRLTYFYNRVFPLIYKLMGCKSSHAVTLEAVKLRILDKIALARYECVECFNAFTSNLINDVSLSATVEERERNVVEYLKLITASLEDDLFIFDYHNTNSIIVQLELLAYFYPDLDPTHTEYIAQYLESLPKLEKILRKKESLQRQEINASQQLPNPTPSTSSDAVPNPVETCKATLSDEDINERIEIIADTFPDVGDAFILECLAYCSYDPIAAITLILDDNLPPSIASMPRNAIRVPPEPEPAQPILAYRGKKPREEVPASTDKELKANILERVTFQVDTYDDEYDDRDEYVPIAVPFASASSEEEDEEDTAPGGGDGGSNTEQGAMARKRESGGHAGGFRPFCEDPAKLREQREMAKRSFRQRGGGSSSHDVTGKAKGQGQDAQVLKNRHKKTANKATRGNHNRKRGAQFKASRGMY